MIYVLALLANYQATSSNYVKMMEEKEQKKKEEAELKDEVGEEGTRAERPRRL